jgi:hypothetical protein
MAGIHWQKTHYAWCCAMAFAAVSSCKQRSPEIADVKAYENSVDICGDIATYSKKVAEKSATAGRSYDDVYHEVWAEEKQLLTELVDRHEKRLASMKASPVNQLKADGMDCDQFKAAVERSQKAVGPSPACEDCGPEELTRRVTSYKSQLAKLSQCESSGTIPTTASAPTSSDSASLTTAARIRKQMAELVLSTTEIANVCGVARKLFTDRNFNQFCDGQKIKDSCSAVLNNGQSYDPLMGIKASPQLTEQLASIRKMVHQCILNTDDLSKYQELSKFQYKTMFAVESCRAAGRLMADSLDFAPLDYFIKECGTGIKKDDASACLRHMSTACDMFVAHGSMDLKGFDEIDSKVKNFTDNQAARFILASAGVTETPSVAASCRKSYEEETAKCKSATSPQACVDDLYYKRLACQSMDFMVAQVQDVLTKGQDSVAGMCLQQIGKLLKTNGQCLMKTAGKFRDELAAYVWVNDDWSNNEGVAREQTCGQVDYRPCCYCQRQEFTESGFVSSGSAVGSPIPWLGVIQNGDFKTGNCGQMEKAPAIDGSTRHEYRFTECKKVFALGTTCRQEHGATVRIWSPGADAVREVRIP